METKDVAFFSTLLNITTEDVGSAVTDGTLGEKITALEMLSKDQVETLKTNLAKEVRTSHMADLSEAAKKGELDNDLYKVIKGAAYEMLEKDLSKEYSIDGFKDVKDLVAKISNKATKTDDKALQELNEKLSALKEVNERLDREKDEAVTAAKTEYEGKLLTQSKSDFVGKVPFDLSDVQDAELDKVTNSRKQILSDVFDARYSLAFDGDKVVVNDKEGKTLTNSATLDPIPASDVLKSLASELGQKLKSPESGGQGGKSSGGKNGTFATQAEFDQYIQDKEINPYSKEGIELFAKSGLAVKK